MGSATSKPAFNVPRYLGRWYELARYPNSFEIGCQDATADYSQAGDGIRITNRCQYPEGRSSEVSGLGTLIGGSTFKVDFPGSMPADYTVLSTDYDNFAFVASNRGRFWILGRRPTVSPAEKSDLIARTRELGYSPQHLIWNK